LQNTHHYSLLSKVDDEKGRCFRTKTLFDSVFYVRGMYTHFWSERVRKTMRQPFKDNDSAYHTVYSQATDPLMRSVTAQMPASYIVQETRGQRIKRGIKVFFAAVFRKINQFIALGLAVMLLLLFTRFLLHFFEITTSVFTGWINVVTAPLVYPFENLAPTLPFNGFIIDVSILVAIVIWTIAVVIVRQFIHLLAGKW